MNYKNGAGLSKSFSNENPTLDIHAQVTITIEPTIVIDLRALRQSLINVQLTTGIVEVITADVDLMGNNPTCLGLYVYVPLRWGINQQNCLLTIISERLKYEGVIWDSENSPVTMRMHIEDGEEVAECTRGDEPVETPPTDENGEPYEELLFFEFVPIEIGFIELSSYSLYVDPNASETISVISVPEGYSTSDLTYSVSDSSICSVDASGNVTGINPGSTNVTISTSDGRFSVMLTVVVQENYEIEDGFQPL